MRPLTQIFMNDDAAGVVGDCYRTSLACLLDLTPEEVPHFVRDHEDYLAAAREWVSARGYVLTMFELEEEHAPWAGIFQFGEVFHMLSGPSPRSPDFWHVVVGRNGQVFHDPHPSGAGLAPGRRVATLLVRHAGPIVVGEAA